MFYNAGARDPDQGRVRFLDPGADPRAGGHVLPQLPLQACKL